ncbi:MAG: hypothetical protein ABIN57_12365 [Chitinophagaceae bacterium]
MKKLVVAAAFALILFACSHKSIPLSNAPVNNTKTDAKVALESGNTNASATTIDAGHSLFSAKCGKCHGLKDPTKYTAGAWDVIMDKMARKAKLNDEQKVQVTAYVKANAKK